MVAFRAFFPRTYCTMHVHSKTTLVDESLKLAGIVRVLATPGDNYHVRYRGFGFGVCIESLYCTLPVA